MDIVQFIAQAGAFVGADLDLGSAAHKPGSGR